MGYPTVRLARAPNRLVAIPLVLALMLPAPVANAGEGSSNEPTSTGVVAVSDLPDVAAPRIDDPISEAELEDLQHFASQQGMPLQAAIDQYAWRDNFALAVNTIQEEYPEALAGAEIVGADGAWIGFAADAPEAAIAIVDTFTNAHPAVAVEVRPGLGFSEVELGEAIATAHYAALDAAGGRDVTTIFDYETRQITSTVGLGAAAAIALDEVGNGAADRVIDSGLGKLLDSITINVVESSVPTLSRRHNNAVHNGGEAITTCTSGFTVRHWDGRQGIVTAGHCQAAQSDDGQALPHQAVHEGHFGDFQWHTGPQVEPDDFYSGNATQLEVNLRDVAGSANPVVGQLLCKNGKSGFKDCDTVRELNVCSWIWCNLVMTENQFGVEGDSGGPWYYNYTTYGVHQGSLFSWGWRSVFSKTTLLFNALDIVVKNT